MKEYVQAPAASTLELKLTSLKKSTDSGNDFVKRNYFEKKQIFPVMWITAAIQTKPTKRYIYRYRRKPNRPNRCHLWEKRNSVDYPKTSSAFQVPAHVQDHC